MASGEKVNILGVELDSVTTAQAVDLICSAIEARAEGKAPFCVVTPNTNMVMNATRSAEFRRTLALADLSTADGVGIVAAARRAGTPLPERVTGIDTGYEVMKWCAGKGKRVFFFGGREGVARKAADRLCAAMPGLCVCGTRNGYFEESENARIIAGIRNASPDLLIVCLGSPKQELWVREHFRELSGIGAVMTLGGSIDVWAGRARRAPALVRKMRLEWAWRMLCDWRRFRLLPDLWRFERATKRSAIRKNAEI